jgi:hypothetical protein
MNRSKYISGYRKPVLPDPLPDFVVGDRVVFKRDIWNGFDWAAFIGYSQPPTFRTRGIVVNASTSIIYVRWEEYVPTSGRGTLFEYVKTEDVERIIPEKA